MRSDKRKQSWYSRLSPLVTVIFLGAFTLLLIAALIGVIDNLNATKTKVTKQEAINKSLTHKYDRLTPDQTLARQASFDLQSHEEKLTKIYKPLVKGMFGKRNPTWFNQNKLVLSNYYGKDNYDKLRKSLVSEMIDDVKTYNITYSDFNYDTKTINIIIYVSYKLNPEYNSSPQGAGYLEVKYNFDTNKGELIKLYVKDEDADE